MIIPSIVWCALQVCGVCVWAHCSAWRSRGRNNPTPKPRTLRRWTERRCRLRESAERRLKTQTWSVSATYGKATILIGMCSILYLHWHQSHCPTPDPRPTRLYQTPRTDARCTRTPSPLCQACARRPLGSNPAASRRWCSDECGRHDLSAPVKKVHLRLWIWNISREKKKKKKSSIPFWHCYVALITSSASGYNMTQKLKQVRNIYRNKNSTAG